MVFNPLKNIYKINSNYALKVKEDFDKLLDVGPPILLKQSLNGYHH
jgi:hypothetical protein